MCKGGKMIVNIISDCADGNARGRLMARCQALFGATPIFWPVENKWELAGNIIDACDASLRTKNVILGNVAPRSGDGTNGTPFFWARVNDNWIFSTRSNEVIWLLEKMFGNQTLYRVDWAHMPDHGDESEVYQFRSFELLPRYAAATIHVSLTGKPEPWAVQAIQNPAASIWWVDAFGNCKTTLCVDELNFEAGERYNVNAHYAARGYKRLCDVPFGEIGVVPGSSGFGDKRFIEIVTGGKVKGGAAQMLGLRSGEQITIAPIHVGVHHV